MSRGPEQIQYRGKRDEKQHRAPSAKQFDEPYAGSGGSDIKAKNCRNEIERFFGRERDREQDKQTHYLAPRVEGVDERLARNELPYGKTV
jgi:hypothetical protein